jgi:hypothetical protein
MADAARLNAILIPKAEQALNWLTESTGLNRTDVVNRALQLYRFVEESTSAGGKVVVVRANGESENVRII